MIGSNNIKIILLYCLINYCRLRNTNTQCSIITGRCHRIDFDSIRWNRNLRGVVHLSSSSSRWHFEVQPSWRWRGTIWNSSWSRCFLWSGNDYERTCQPSCQNMQLSITTYQINSTFIAYDYSDTARKQFCNFNMILLGLPKYQQNRLQCSNTFDIWTQPIRTYYRPVAW